MKIECILKRPGGTHVDLGDVDYHFAPNEKGRHVCEVDNEDHVRRFLSIAEAYCWYSESSEPKPLPQSKPASQSFEDDDDKVLGDDDEPASAIRPTEETAPVPDAGRDDGGAGPSEVSTAAAVTSDGAPAKSVDDMTRDELIVAHQKMFGRKPHPRISDDKIREMLKVGV